VLSRPITEQPPTIARFFTLSPSPAVWIIFLPSCEKMCQTCICSQLGERCSRRQENPQLRRQCQIVSSTLTCFRKCACCLARLAAGPDILCSISRIADSGTRCLIGNAGQGYGRRRCMQACAALAGAPTPPPLAVSCSYAAHSRRVGRRSRERLRQSTVFWWRKTQRVWLLRNRVGPWWQVWTGPKIACCRGVPSAGHAAVRYHDISQLFLNSGSVEKVATPRRC
jgi:hypothetical protein